MANNFIEQIIESDLESGRVSKIQTRFPPEPNGYLHIGHAKAICIDFGMAQKYNGKCFLRYDDTNPAKEDVEYVDAIEEDIKWLGFTWAKIVYASDYFDVMYKCALELIEKGLAYVCDLSAEQIHQTRGTLTQAGQESPYRNRSVEENLSLFLEMKEGKYLTGEKVLRAKIDMSSPNLNMRDPVIYRVLHETHHHTGDAWCIYPMYDFAHPIEDAVEGTTHSLCSLEFEDHRPLYDWVIDNCSGKYFASRPHQTEFARLNITDTIMSKRFLKSLVDQKLVLGWDDPRMPTLCGMRRKGYPASAIRDFCERIGVAKSNSEVEMTYLESCVREHLNAESNRVMAVTSPIKVTLSNYSQTEKLDIENNPNAEKVSYRKVPFSNVIYIDGSDFALIPPPKYHRLVPDGYVRLKGAHIIHCDKVITDEKGEVVELICSVVPNSKSGNDTSGLKVKGVIQWVDAETGIHAVIRKFGNLLSDDDKEKALADRFNQNSLTETPCMVEKSLGKSKIGETYQFMRLGYYCLDRDSSKNQLIFNQVVTLKDAFNK